MNTEAASEDKDTALITIGRFSVHELIAVGGMAEVYRASMDGPGGFRKPIVIKRVKQKHAAEDEFIKMFIDEAKLSATLDHPNIVSVYELGKAGDNYYIAMEYVDGLNLFGAHVAYEAKHGGPMPWQAVTLIVRDMLKALDFAHQMTDPNGKPLGIVHRDVNLANAMLRRDGVVKVLDFGIAKAREGIRQVETIQGVLKGKFAYMSPEQVRGDAVDPRTDVFTTAIVYHELLTGRRLFGGDEPMTILRAVRDAPIPEPRQIIPDIPESVAEAAMKGLARDINDRFPSAGDMADALEEIVYEHRIKGTTLRDLAKDTMPPPAEALPKEEATRRKKLTLLAWTEGAPETGIDDMAGGEAGSRPVFPVRKKEASGMLQVPKSDQDSIGTALAKSPLHTTESWWEVPEDDRDESDIDPEKDTVIEEATPIASGLIEKVAELARIHEQKTEILQEEDAEKPEPSATGSPLQEQKTEILKEEHTAQSDPVPDPGPIQDLKTEILKDTDDAPAEDKEEKPAPDEEDKEEKPAEDEEDKEEGKVEDKEEEKDIPQPTDDDPGTAPVTLPESRKDETEKEDGPMIKPAYIVAAVAALIIVILLIWKYS